MSIFVSAPFGNYIRTNKTISVTGSWTLQKRTGRLVQILKTLRYTKKGWVNKIGLRNPGIEVGLNKHMNSQVLSIAGINKDDWSILAEKIPQNVNLEINLSCPNIEHNYIDGIENFNFLERDWFIGKISPLTTFKELDMYINKFKFKQIHACNTLPTEKGGLSGAELIPYTSKYIKYLKKNYPRIEVIAGGGIYDFDQISSYYDLGAEHVSLGTVCFNPNKLLKILRKI